VLSEKWGGGGRREAPPVGDCYPPCNPLFALGFPGFATWVSGIFWGFAATDYANGATIVERPAGNPAFRSRYLPSRLKAPAMRPSRPAATSSTSLVAWYRSVYAPRTGGAYDSHHRTTGIAGCTRRRGGRVAARGARAASW